MIVSNRNKQLNYIFKYGLNVFFFFFVNLKIRIRTERLNRNLTRILIEKKRGGKKVISNKLWKWKTRWAEFEAFGPVLIYSAIHFRFSSNCFSHLSSSSLNPESFSLQIVPFSHFQVNFWDSLFCFSKTQFTSFFSPSIWHISHRSCEFFLDLGLVILASSCIFLSRFYLQSQELIFDLCFIDLLIIVLSHQLLFVYSIATHVFLYLNHFLL